MDGLNKRRSAVSAVYIPARKLKNSSPSRPPLQDVVDLMDYELVPLNFPATSYMSLKDIIPAGSPSSSILSPTPLAITSAVSSPPYGSGCEISIRNHLVKQAAWAYLQTAVPSSPSLSSSSGRLCFSGEFFRSIMATFRKWSCETVKYVYDWLVDVLWLILCR